MWTATVFFDNQRFHATGLAEYLSNQGISEVYIAGLATDYCVKYTALDAVSLYFKLGSFRMRVEVWN